MAIPVFKRAELYDCFIFNETSHSIWRLRILLNNGYRLSLIIGGYPQFSFWTSIVLAKICFSRKVINHTKILRY